MTEYTSSRDSIKCPDELSIPEVPSRDSTEEDFGNVNDNILSKYAVKVENVESTVNDELDSCLTISSSPNAVNDNFREKYFKLKEKFDELKLKSQLAENFNRLQDDLEPAKGKMSNAFMSTDEVFQNSNLANLDTHESLIKKIKEKDMKLEQLNKENQHKDELILHLNTCIKDKHDDCSIFRETNKNLITQLTFYEARCGELEKTNKVLEDRIQSLVQDKSDMNMNLENKKDAITTMRNKIKDQDQRIRLLESKMKRASLDKLSAASQAQPEYPDWWKDHQLSK